MKALSLNHLHFFSKIFHKIVFKTYYCDTLKHVVDAVRNRFCYVDDNNDNKQQTTDIYIHAELRIS